MVRAEGIKANALQEHPRKNTRCSCNCPAYQAVIAELLPKFELEKLDPLKEPLKKSPLGTKCGLQLRSRIDSTTVQYRLRVC